MTEQKPIFRDINADDPEPETTQIESLCVNCQENGITRILLTKIPYYKEVIVMSFTCEKCGYQNNEIQSGAPVGPKGVKYTLTVETADDLNRQIVKSDYASIKIVELDFEISANSQKGEITTVEGVIDRSIKGLEQDQPVRRIEHPDTAKKIDDFIEKLQKLKDMTSPFTLILEDISGNSFIENPKAPQKDPSCIVQYFKRNKEQDHQVGIYTREEIGDDNDSKSEENANILHPLKEGEFTLEDLQGEVLQFPTNCPNCNSPCQTNMKLTNIPHFKEVVIMATTCDICGIRTNEVKSGGGIEPKGVHIEVDINSKDDFSRDLLKSDTCELKIPQLELEVGPHALGGRFTTVEGILIAIKEQLIDGQHAHLFGDSRTEESRKRFQHFLKQFDEILDGNRKITLVLDDPAGNSYIQSLNEENPDKPDEHLRVEHYERSFEQNDELGLNEMKTENYENN